MVDVIRVYCINPLIRSFHGCFSRFNFPVQYSSPPEAFSFPDPEDIEKEQAVFAHWLLLSGGEGGQPKEELDSVHRI